MTSTHLPEHVEEYISALPPEKQMAARDLWDELDPIAEKLEGKGFDYCISNPPYQATTSRDGEANSQSENIFHHFYTAGNALAKRTVMIFPGGRWMQRGSQAAHDAIMPTVEQVYWYPNSSDTPVDKRIFPIVDITDGVSIVVSKSTAPGSEFSPTLLLNGVEVERPGATGILPLGRGSAELLAKLPLKKNIMALRAPTGVFGLRTYYVERNPKKVSRAVSAQGRPLKAPARFKNPIKAYLGNEVPGSGKKTELYWIDESSLEWDKKNRRELAAAWKVVMTQAGANKNPETRRVWVVPAGTIVGETLNILASFPTEAEAENFAAYLRTPLVKRLLAMSKGGHSKALGIFVPDLEDYSSENPLFQDDAALGEDHEFHGLSLSERLKVKFSLDDEDVAAVAV